MPTYRVVQPEVLTQHIPAKVALATVGVAGASAYDALCQTNAATGAACALAAGVPVLLKLLLAMQGLDLVTGVLAARQSGERVHSRRFAVGVQRKTVMLIVVLAAVILDALFREHGISLDGLLFKWTTSWFIATEALSLYENGEKMGLPMPTFLQTAMNALLERAKAVTVPGNEPPEPMPPVE